MKKFAIAGCGRLGRIVAKAWHDGLLPEYVLCGTYSRTYGHALALASEYGCKACGSVDELLDMSPDIVVETASPAAMKEMALPLLAGGVSIVSLSIGALADNAFYQEVSEAAISSGAKIYVASGATGGFDVLQTASLMLKGTEDICVVDSFVISKDKLLEAYQIGPDAGTLETCANFFNDESQKGTIYQNELGQKLYLSLNDYF